MSNPPSTTGLTAIGKVFSFLLILGLVLLGGWIAMRRNAGHQNASRVGSAVTATDKMGSAARVPTSGHGPSADESVALTETQTTAPRLGAAFPYLPRDNTVDIELSEYAGYAGLIVANGGLEPSDASFFARNYGFKVRIKLSEEESWNALNAGKMAASATTADVLAVYGRQFQVVVPAQIGYSRGADGLVVRNDIRKVNDLKGKLVVSSQFTESDFFIRYLAREAGISIKMLPDLGAAPDEECVNLVYTEDGESAGKFFVNQLATGRRNVAGCVTWAPFTTEIPSESGGKARLLVSNKNLLIVADILIVNKGFADQNPKMVQGLVDGLLAGNKTVRENPEASAGVIGAAFKWDRAKTLSELQKVSLANLPEQLAFFNAGITQGGSFASIYQSAVLAYGADLIPNPVDSDHFLSLDALKAIQAAGTYKSDVPAITPIAAGPGAPAEMDPVLSKDIRFFFEPNSSKLDMNNKENLANLDSIKRILDVSPGSHMVLVGHVDNSRIPELMRMGGQSLVDKTALDAMQLSKERANEIRDRLVEREKSDPRRLETVPRGWTQPVSATNPDLNRRVEVQWFTLE